MDCRSDLDRRLVDYIKNSGEGNGDLRLFFTENTGQYKRTGTVKVSMSGAGSTLEQEISVEQLQR